MMTTEQWNKLDHDLLNEHIRRRTPSDNAYMAGCRLAGDVAMPGDTEEQIADRVADELRLASMDEDERNQHDYP